MILETLTSILGLKNIITDKQDMSAYLEDWRGNHKGDAQAILLPTSTEMVSEIMRLADEHDLYIVPQGGNTGLVGGGIPDDTGRMFVLSLGRMRAIRSLSVENHAMVVEAGCILQDLHEAADQHDLYFPLNLAAKGSCSIGGNLSTNAGGINVLRYGNTRDLCLGIEVVLMGGRVMNLLTSLRKDNTGYDLKHLFIGGEGTLGIITAASLKLFPKPKARATAMASIPDPQTGVALLGALKQATGDLVEAFEIMPRDIFNVVAKQFPSLTCPIQPVPEMCILMEIASSDEALGTVSEDGTVPLVEKLNIFLAQEFETGRVLEAVVAQNETQRQAMWDIREHAPDSTKAESHPVNTDVSVSLSDIGTFYDHAIANVRKICPDVRICAYGHIGDGNIHFNVIEKLGGDADWAAKRPQMFAAIYEALYAVDGSISAEHGIGQLKAEQLRLVKDPVALEMMQVIKQSFDPKNLLNPGRILS